MPPRSRLPHGSALRKISVDDIVHRIAIEGKLDLHAVEALKLEMHQLAKRYGIRITARRVAPRGT